MVRRIEIIDEAIKNIPSGFRNKYPEISWKSVAGMRDKLMHHYFGVDLEKVWKTIIDDIPRLKEEIKEILKREPR